MDQISNLAFDLTRVAIIRHPVFKAQKEEKDIMFSDVDDILKYFSLFL